MSMKSKLLLLSSMAAMFADVDRFMAQDRIKKEGLGGFRDATKGTDLTKQAKHIKVKKTRSKNKLAKKSRKKNRKH
jgi:hypothetical protein